MAAEGTRLIRSGRRALLAAFASVLLASCATSEPDVPFGFAAAGLTPTQLQQQPEAAAAESTGEQADAVMVSTFVVEEGDPVLPDMIAAAPVLRPGSEQPADVPVPALAAAATPAATQPATPAFAAGTPPLPALAASEERETIDAAQGATPEASNGEAAMQVAALAPAAPMQAKKRGFLSSFFAPAPQQPQAARPLIDPAATRQSEASAATSAAPARPLVQFASAGQPARPLVATNAAQGATPLPGVREGNALYEISRRSGMDDDSDIDLHEGDEPGLQLASAAGLARLAPNGLMKQTDNVDVACLKPSLVRVLKAIEKQYGRKVVVTSGYRSPDRNKRARGARNSLHMYCAAADVQVEGISKWDLAKFVRTMPGRGGVGTYCHTDSVHIDVGPERDWNWRCRRRK